MSRDSDRYARVHAIVSRARSLDGAALESLLASECGDDAALREEVLELLAVGRDSSFGAPFAEAQVESARAALAGVLEGPGAEWVPERIGEYRVVRPIGQGGMGVVYEAEQSAPRRRVAIKLLHPQQVTTERLRRFQQEVALLGQLQHPGIAQIFEAGTFDAGRGPQPYFAMELVEGIDIRTYCDRNRLDRRRRLELIAKVADIVHYAHGCGIVHRDLKPDNVLVDGRGEPRVLDFGIAHASADSAEQSTALTKEGQLIGTLAYMAPEQLSGEKDRITPRVDVFALGVLAFELLLERGPRDSVDGPLPELILRLGRAEPLRAGALDSSLRGDVDTILGKALETEPKRRYESAADFAADVRRHLQNVPIRAHPPSTAYVVGKFVRRHRSLVAGLVVTVLAGAVAAGFWREASQRATELEEKDSDLSRLSATVDYASLVQRAETLWPPHPDRKEALAAWVADSHALTDELSALVAKRDELRSLALPRTSEEREAERRGHPDFEELARAQAELELRKNALAQRRDGIAVPLPEVDWESQPDDAAGLHLVARPLVHPGRDTFGGEGLALVLAQRALELAPPEERWSIAMTVTLANFELGRDEEAIEAVQRVAEEVTGAARTGRERAIAALVTAVEEVNSEQGLYSQTVRIDELTERVAELEPRVDERRSWTRFPPEVEAERRPHWWLERLRKSIDEIESLTGPGGLASEDGVDPVHGWSVPKRLAFAQRLESEFGPEGDFALRWAAALPEIEAAHPELELGPQMGLVPIGRDPSSGLFEFWHVQSGTEPARGPDGALNIAAESGLVFVLLPRATFRMGAQVQEPNKPLNWNRDPRAQKDEKSVHEVQLSPFFLSKYEMTQGQWRRVAVEDPSRWTTETAPEAGLDATHPVEQTQWIEAVDLLARLGLQLPSEAQWEHAARAGTDTVWAWPEEALSAHANLADQAHGRAFSQAQVESWDDGFALHAPIGVHRPNGFGFHDMIGNVSEWCLDDYDAEYYKRSVPLDPLCSNGPSGDAVHRGGACTHTAGSSRAAARRHAPRTSYEVGVGVRPARPVLR